MYCESCGREMPPGAGFCPSCGHRAGDISRKKILYEKKDPGMAALLSAAVPGLGIMYSGRIAAGLLLFLFAVCGMGVGLVSAVSMGSGTDPFTGFTAVILWSVFAGQAVIWVLGIALSYKYCEEYNNYLQTHGVPPQ